jgi:hypothetical protein
MWKMIRDWVLAGVLPVILSFLPGCTKPVQQELDQTQARLRALQELVDAVNGELTSLNQIVAELDDSHTLLPGSVVETEDGYELSFKDGRKISIHIGRDGQDGRSIVPVGVRLEEDGLYYWTVDGEWLLDADGRRMRAGSVDGTDGYVPQTKVEDDFWWISMDGGATWEKLAGCGEMDGLGVFKDMDITALGKVLLTLWDGTVMEIPSRFPFKMSFAGPVRDTVLIAAGETLPIPYEVLIEGETDQPLTVTSGTDGVYLSQIETGETPGKGVVKVRAPKDYADGYILLSASCGGYSALKMITFRPREIIPADARSTVRLGSGSESKTIPYKTNFEYVVQTAEGSWLEIVPDPETETLTFTALPNTGGEVRTCEVTVRPKDNPDYVCTTFRVYQATESFTIRMEDGGRFAFDAAAMRLEAPAEGGDTDLWMTFPSELSASVPGEEDWLRAEVVTEDGFHRLKVHVDPVPDAQGREANLLIQLKTGGIPIGEIKVVQAGE